MNWLPYVFRGAHLYSDQTGPGGYLVSAWIWPLSLTAVLFAAVYSLVPIRFVENDDLVMMALASGRYSGEPSPTLVFVNQHLGVLLSSAYRIHDGVEWYVVCQLLVLSFSAAAPLAVLVERFRAGETNSIVPFALLLAALASCVVGMQFTTTASVALSVGVWTILTSPRGAHLTMGSMLVLAGMLLRFEAAALALIVLAPLICIWVIIAPLSRYRLISLGVVLAVGFGLHLSGKRDFSTQYPEYAEYIQLGGQIGENPNGTLSADQLPEGLSENDYRLFRGFFPDAAQVDATVLRKIDRTIKNRVATLPASAWFDTAWKLLDRPDIHLPILLILLIALSSRGWHVALLAAPSAAAFFLPLLYVEMTATLKPRVLFSAQFPIYASMFFLGLRSKSLIVSIAGILISISLIKETVDALSEDMVRYAQEREVFHDQAALIATWNGTVFVHRSDFLIEGALMFSEDIHRIPSQVTFLGWMVHHPDNGRYDGFLDLLAPDTVIFFRSEVRRDAQLRNITQAFEENYSLSVRHRVVRETATGALVRLEQE